MIFKGFRQRGIISQFEYRFSREKVVLSRLFAGVQRGGCSFHGVLAWNSAGRRLPRGTLVYVKFSHTPDDNGIRAALQRAGLQREQIQRYGAPSNNEVIIDLDVRETNEQALDQGKVQIINALEQNAPPGKQDLNNASSLTIENYLLEKDPLRAGTDARQKYTALARAIVDYRDKVRGGVLSSLDELKSAVDPSVVASLQEGFFISDFGIRNVEIVGPQVGQQLRKQALLATLYSLLGMLVYLGFRFEWIYGVAAVVTVFHDTLITVGAFSLMNKEISLTVIAAILTLIGYSNNDTIVIFDRIRENIKLMRRERLGEIVNRSINQTLSRTILTAGLTFLTVLALYLFGGEVLHGFSFALVVGILIGTILPSRSQPLFWWPIRIGASAVEVSGSSRHGSSGTCCCRHKELSR